MTTRLQTIANLASGDAVPESWVDDVMTDVNYLVVAGADLVCANMLNLTARFHKVTGNTQLNTLTDALGAVAGQEVELWFTGTPIVSASAGNIKTPTGADRQVAANEVIRFVYDGTNWRVVDRGLNVTVSAWAGGPPASPVDKDVWIATAVDANGLRWTFQYNAGSGSSSKWEFCGGGWLRAEVDTLESITSSTYVNLATVGPQITLARAGDYVIRHGAAIAGPQNAGAGFISLMSYDVGATGAIDADAAIRSNSANGAFNDFASVMRERAKTGITAAATITCKYRTTAGTTSFFQWRWMAIQPVRIA